MRELHVIVVEEGEKISKASAHKADLIITERGKVLKDRYAVYGIQEETLITDILT